MANVKITELPVATVVNDADSLVIVQAGVTKQAPNSLVSSGAAGIYTIESSSAGGTGVGNAAVQAWMGCPASNAAVNRIWIIKHNTDDNKIYAVGSNTALGAEEPLKEFGFGGYSGLFNNLSYLTSCPAHGGYFPAIYISANTFTDPALLPAIGFASDGGVQYLGEEFNSTFNPDSTEVIIGNNAAANSRGVAVGDGANAGSYTVAVGQGSNSTGQWGVSIGYGAVTTGSRSVSVGQGAAASGNSSVAVGNNAKTGASGVSVGASAGATSQGSNCVAIGGSAGNNTQGASAVAIGFQAGKTNQAASSIVINATGVALDNTTTDTFVVKPVRDVAGTIPAGFKQVAYNPTTGEFISYG